MNVVETQQDDFLVINTTAPTRVVEEPILPLPILSDGHPKLAERMEEFDLSQVMNPEIQKFIKQLKLTMTTYGGLGLSANQCGIRFRMFVMGSDEFQMVCINPKIVETFGEPEKMREGCLSYPGLYLNVPRYKKIVVEHFDHLGEYNTTTLEGISAQVYQHELDHMNGVVYTNKVGPLALELAKKRQKKLIRKISKIK
jgi:peptide deformylase